MSYSISFQRRPEYLYVRVTGENSRDNVMGYLADLERECEAIECFRVLVDERLEGPRLPEMEVFAIASEGSKKALGKFEAIAYVDEQMGDMAQFAETAAVSRGMPVAIFSNVEDADRWLNDLKPGSEEQLIFWDREAQDLER